MENQRGGIEVSINGQTLIGAETPTIDGKILDRYEQSLATFETERGVLSVDFSHYDEQYNSGGNKGTVILEGDFLKSFGHSALRKNLDSLRGIREVHTGYENQGAVLLGKNENGIMRTLTVVLH